MMYPVKRVDIQWLRALAILGVSGFHIWPNYFPYGYLGVDVFFVISGYLMTFILSSNAELSVLTFYARRISRIFPIFMLVILICVFIGYFTLLPSYFSFLQTESLWSIFFINNFSTMFAKEEYFKLVSDYKFLLHTWSLGVEIQFYLMAPFLLKLILGQSKPIIVSFILAFISILMQLFIPNKSVAFGLVFCRMWQFLIGSIAYLWTQKNIVEPVLKNEAIFSQTSEVASLLEQKNEKTVLSVYKSVWIRNISKISLLLLSLLFVLPFNSSSFIQPMQQLIITFLTGIFIVSNSQLSMVLPSLINGIFVYIGNASYSVYLVHWPVIIYFKYFNIFELYGSFFTLLCIFLISLVSYECFEKPLSKISIHYIFPFIIICYFAIIYLSLTEKTHFSNISLRSFTTKEIADAIQLNEVEAKSCSSKTFYLKQCNTDPIIEKYLTRRPKEHRLDVYCSYKQSPTIGKTVLITGNSYIWFQSYGISEAIKRSKTHFSKVYILAHPGCSILFGELNNNHKTWDCENFDGSYDELIKAIKPDLIIHSARFDHFFVNDTNSKITFNETNLSNAALNIANLTKRLIVIQPNPIFFNLKKSDPSTISRLLLTNQNMSDYSITVEDFQNKVNFSWGLFLNAIKHCSNCIIVNTQNNFCDEIKCYFMDPLRKIVRYCDVAHVTPNESLKLVPDLTKAIDMI